MKTFIKWVGGKRGILKKLKEFIPDNYNNYYEPFLGGGALFFDLNPTKAFIGDINKELITTYLVVRNDAENLLKVLREHADKHNSEYFYQVRKNQFPSTDIETAARFIYLNKTCYNGLYRVNLKGEFNSPEGKYKNPNIFDPDTILNCREHIIKTNSVIECKSFDAIKPSRGDFVYFDPPYHKTYSGYSKDIFDEKMQIKLRDFCDDLTKKGVLFTLSNSDTTFIRELYKDYNITEIIAPRFINCKSHNRKGGREIIVTNYP